MKKRWSGSVCGSGNRNVSRNGSVNGSGSKSENKMKNTTRCRTRSMKSSMTWKRSLNLSFLPLSADAGVAGGGVSGRSGHQAHERTKERLCVRREIQMRSRCRQAQLG